MRLPVIPTSSFEDATLDFEFLQGLFQPPGGLFLSARAYRVAAMTTTGAGFQLLPVDTLNWDDTNGAMDVTSVHGFTCPTAGRYLAISSVDPAATAAGQIISVAIAKSGVVVAQGATTSTANAANQGGQVVDILNCKAGDVITAQIYTNAAMVVPVNNSHLQFLTVMRVA